MNLLPYTRINEEWMIPDTVLRSIWARMEAEGTARAFFFDGKVRDTDQFITVCQNPNVYTAFLFDDEGDPVAMGMLNSFQNGSAHAHWLCFKKIWGKLDTNEAIDICLRHWFSLKSNGTPLFDILLGIYPDENKHIGGFARRAGFTVIGTIPGLLYNAWENRKMGAVFSYIERSAVWDS